MNTIKTYYWLTKPGIIYGNAMTAAAGFLLASKGDVDFLKLLATLLGISLVIACGCVINNYIDRNIDLKMNRTKKRALVIGMVSNRSAIIYGIVLGILGTTILAFYTNPITFVLGAVGLFFYLVMYSVFKRRSVYGTIVGSVSGATPLAAGYTAVTGRFDTLAALLFLIMTLWQMPHFYAIAMYRLKDYKAAGIPVWPVKKGLPATKVQIMAYILAFIFATTSLTLLGHTGNTYFVIMLAFGLAWLRLGLKGFKSLDDTAWARRMFGFSLVVLLALSAVLSLDSLLP